MDKNKISSAFSRDAIGGLIVVAVLGGLWQPTALAQVSGNVTFGANGPVANMPAIQNSTPSNVAGPAMNSLGDTGVIGRSTYKSGEAPEDAGMSGLISNPSSQNYPINGPGNNFGPNMSGAVNGLMAPNSVGGAPLRQWGGAGYGFNANPQNQVYSMATGVNKVIQNVVNDLGGGILTIGGPRLPVTSTGSIDLNSTGSWPPGK
ncbi:MAG: hypothetical protein KGS72_19100 [Cyanobacteria bacterium REEB67]|nr:hypothetical protein [Cyanobacteria bacterium REEB67]